ncbi:unnamed protein product [Amoebophrya sp. A120]|nr:unnamed protein product [Amoebophrya sp. A120]|eukprot:GSA120T00005635001.1
MTAPQATPFSARVQKAQQVAVALARDPTNQELWATPDFLDDCRIFSDCLPGFTDAEQVWAYLEDSCKSAKSWRKRFAKALTVDEAALPALTEEKEAPVVSISSAKIKKQHRDDDLPSTTSSSSSTTSSKKRKNAAESHEVDEADAVLDGVLAREEARATKKSKKQERNTTAGAGSKLKSTTLLPTDEEDAEKLEEKLAKSSSAGDHDDGNKSSCDHDASTSTKSRKKKKNAANTGGSKPSGARFFGEMEDDGDDSNVAGEHKKKHSKPKSQVDDEFFSLADMQKFAEEGEKAWARMNDNESDSDNADEDEVYKMFFSKDVGDGDDIMFDDFFGTGGRGPGAQNNKASSSTTANKYANLRTTDDLKDLSEKEATASKIAALKGSSGKDDDGARPAVVDDSSPTEEQNMEVDEVAAVVSEDGSSEEEFSDEMSEEEEDSEEEDELIRMRRERKKADAAKEQKAKASVEGAQVEPDAKKEQKGREESDDAELPTDDLEDEEEELSLEEEISDEEEAVEGMLEDADALEEDGAPDENDISDEEQPEMSSSSSSSSCSWDKDAEDAGKALPFSGFASDGEDCDLSDLDAEDRQLELALRKVGRTAVYRAGGKMDNLPESDEDTDADENGGMDVDMNEESSVSSNQAKANLAVKDRRIQDLEEEVDRLEREALAQKHWSLGGEVAGKQRERNSLLELHLDLPMTHFQSKRTLDTAIATGQQLDEEESDEEGNKPQQFDIEQITKQRVADNLFDDVIRVADTRPSTTKKDEDQEEVLNFAKSRVGLADIYAQQYEEEVFGQKSKQEEKMSKEKLLCKELFGKVMYKLDQLCNAHFTPKPVSLCTSTAKANVSSMTIEEAVPLAVSTAAMTAPSEIRRGDTVKTHDELDREELNAVRRRRKDQRKKALEGHLIEGTKTAKDLQDRQTALDKKNQIAKEKKNAKGKVKDKKKKLKNTELLQMAADKTQAETSRKADLKKWKEGNTDTGKAKVRKSKF